MCLTFGIGVASGLPMEFEFGTNWAPFSLAVGDFFGSVLGFEASMAFALEAGFLGIMLFGWERVPAVMHYFATIMVAIGANLSIFWILSANSWLQTPAGGQFIDGHFVVGDYFQAIFNPFMLNSVLHMFFATLETSLFVIGGISAWYILNKRNSEFFTLSFQDRSGDRHCRNSPSAIHRTLKRRTSISLSANQTGSNGSSMGNNSRR